MSKTAKIICAIVVVAILAVLIWQGVKSGNESAGENSQTGSVFNSYANAPEPSSMSAPNDASDAGLAKDSASLDAQIRSLDADSARADQNLNDKPVN